MGSTRLLLVGVYQELGEADLDPIADFQLMPFMLAQNPPEMLFIPSTFPSNQVQFPTGFAELHLQLGLFIPSNPKLALSLSVEA